MGFLKRTYKHGEYLKELRIFRYMFTDTYENIFPSNYPSNSRQIYNSSEKNNDETFVVKLDVSQFKPVELTVRVDGDKLLVAGKHQNKSQNGFENCEFQREYTIPSDVLANSITSRITPSGVLIIEGDKNKDQYKTNLSNEATDLSDNCVFHISVNISGFKPEDISVKLLNNDLVVEGKQTYETKSEDNKQKLKRNNGFVYNFTLPPDVDINNLVPKFTSNSRLDIEAPKTTRRQECEKNLEIKSQKHTL